MFFQLFLCFISFQQIKTPLWCFRFRKIKRLDNHSGHLFYSSSCLKIAITFEEVYGNICRCSCINYSQWVLKNIQMYALLSKHFKLTFCSFFVIHFIFYLYNSTNERHMHKANRIFPFGWCKMICKIIYVGEKGWSRGERNIK